MGRIAFRAAIVTVVLIAMSAMAGGTGASATRSREPITVFPRVGIGPVRLGEKRAAVDRALGKAQLQHRGPDSGSYRYRSGEITILVSYDSGGRADGVMTHSRAAVLYGRRLAEGLAKLRPVVRKHRWKIFSCRGETFTFVFPGGPGTGIAWRSNRLDEVFVTGGGSVGEQCLPLSLLQ
jgi:hypothetical protein